jgi:hypothetical protein
MTRARAMHVVLVWGRRLLRLVNLDVTLGTGGIVTAAIGCCTGVGKAIVVGV